MSNRTPGPWAYFHKWKYNSHHVSLPLTGGGMRLGLFPRDGIETENPEADARLIAAAPELLDALKAIVSSLSEHDEEGLIEHVEPMRKARAAIAKAEGVE